VAFVHAVFASGSELIAAFQDLGIAWTAVK